MPERERRLIRAAQQGSEEACRDLVRRFERPVFSLIVRMVRDPALAEDLSQEVFVKAFRALDSFQPGRKFSSWLFKIAHNTAIDHLRRKTPSTVALETDLDRVDPIDVVADSRVETPEAVAVRGDLARAFEEALGRLRPQYREVVVLRFQEGLAYEEIAEVTGLPLGTVKTHIHRARKALAEEMIQMGWGPPGGGKSG